jgi:hypothetical protein
MGKFEKGVLGGFNGKVGTVVGSTWKGKSVMRSRPPAKRTSPPSAAQLAVQAKFTLMTKFLRPLTGLFTQTYKNLASGMTSFNKAFSDNIQIAITGVYPALAVDYTKVIISKGNLPNGDSPAAASAVAGQLVFTWKDNSGTEKALISDTLFVAAYSADLNRWLVVQKAATRNAATYTMDATAFSGKPVQTYIGFTSADGKIISTSIFTGAVNVL